MSATRTPARPTEARHTRPIDDAEYNDLCACRCGRLPGTHTAGQCLSSPRTS
ncbi:hypothetical protein V5P93_005813 [Actinokineospora auranticolor]|uniref:Uncharacterized protein n=1 Tax=Actinokineospora auranticolor TaxID=155976 RepID=A0A2S6GJL5_9PSEU|nr:hypothetical protein [Actinokineospora auranticolor]PPK65409.1 hypothetical protein CLV40_11461 [Actinokineospora auranticolor]